jgi:hypothetical protein
MKVYSVLLSTRYEGEDLLGVFASREQAEAFARSQEWYSASSQFGIVESELGQPIDFHAMVEWVE